MFENVPRSRTGMVKKGYKKLHNPLKIYEKCLFLFLLLFDTADNSSDLDFLCVHHIQIHYPQHIT